MGGRIAEQVRRGLIVAAKTAPMVVAIDAVGCEKAEVGCAPPVCQSTTTLRLPDAGLCKSGNRPLEECAKLCGLKYPNACRVDCVQRNVACDAPDACTP